MCGKDPHIFQVVEINAGITPACAGKTQICVSSHFTLRDHPRMCGKDQVSKATICLKVGSPPHVRERLFVPSYRTFYYRITPACAGKTAFTAVVPS